MGNLTAVLAACCIIFPGFIITLLLRRQRDFAADFLCSALFGLLIASFPVWFPPARVISLSDWTLVLFLLSGGALLFFVIAAVRKLQHFRLKRQRTRVKLYYFIPWFILLAGYITILLTRAIVGWDEVNYYLPAAQNYVALNHFSDVFSEGFRIEPNVPVWSPPLAPWLYALAIVIGRDFHQPADATVRLVPFLFLLVFWLATQRLAYGMLSKKYAKYGALLTASLPLLLFNTVAQALYLDIPIAACLAALIAATLFERQWFKPVSVGAWALLAVITKITGLPLILALAFCFAVYHVGGIRARIAIGAVVAVLFLLTAKLMLLTNFVGIVQWTSVALITSLLWYSVPGKGTPCRIDLRSSFVALLAFCPAIWYSIERAKTSGLSDYYVSVPLISHPDNWNWARELIDRSMIWNHYISPAIPEHLGVGLLLWWGFAPLVMFFALAGVVLALRNKSCSRLMITICSMLLIIWLTVFHSQDYRHILLILPFEAIFALYALQNIRTLRRNIDYAIACFFGALMPLAWVAQEKYYNPPLEKFLFSQDRAWTTPALGMMLFASCISIVLMSSLGITKRVVQAHEKASFMNYWPWLVALLAGVFAGVIAGIAPALTLITTFVIVGIATVRRPALLKNNLKSLTTLGVLSVALIGSFEPLIATGLGNDFASNRRRVSNLEFMGYSQALRQSNAEGVSGILGFLTYGVPWFSGKITRSIDIGGIDAIDLATLKDYLQSPNVTALLFIMQNLGVTSAIFPAESNSYYGPFRKFVNSGRLTAVQGLYDPLFSTLQKEGDWNLLRMEPNSHTTPRCELELFVKSSRSLVSLEHSNGLHINASRQALEIVLRHCGQIKGITADLSYSKGEQSSNEIEQHYIKNFTPRFAAVQRYDETREQTLSLPNVSPMIVVKSLKVNVISMDNRVNFVNWRSPHLTVIFKGGSAAEVTGDVLVSHPEKALISFVSLENDSENQLKLYPKPVESVGAVSGTLPIYARIMTRASFDCTEGSPVSITIDASVFASNRLLNVQKTLRTRIQAAALVDIDSWLEEIAREHAGIKWISLTKVSARGMPSRLSRVPSYCSAQETLGVPHVSLRVVGDTLSFVEGTQALVINDVR